MSAAPNQTPPATLVDPAVLRFFPDAEPQAHRITALKGRLRAWNVCLGEVAKAFESLANLDREAEKIYANLAKVFVADDKEVAGSAAHLGKAREVLGHLALEQRDYAKSLQRTANLFSSIKDSQLSYSKSLASSIDKAWEKIDKSRVATVAAIRKFEYDKDRLPDNTDPWLVDQILRNAITRGVTAENEFQKEMNALLAKLRETETQLVASLSKAFTEHSVHRKTHSTNLLIPYSNLSQFLTQLPPSAPFDTFNVKHDVLTPKCLTTERKVPEFPFTLPKSRVLKQGLLARPGGFFKSWKDGWGVITDRGYFHLFEHSRGNMVTRAIGWTEGPKYETMDKPETVLSVKLRRPGVEIGIPIPAELLASSGGSLNASATQRIVKNTEEHAFELTVSPEMGSEGKHLLRCETEEEMVDWITAVRRMLDQSGRAVNVTSMVANLSVAAAGGLESRSNGSSGQSSPVRTSPVQSRPATPPSEPASRAPPMEPSRSPSTVRAAQPPAQSVSPAPQPALQPPPAQRNEARSETADLLGGFDDAVGPEAPSPTSTSNPWNASRNVFGELNDDFFATDSFAGQTESAQGSGSNFEEVKPAAQPPSAGNNDWARFE